MSLGPILIFDKSTLQSLNVDEACWLDNFYRANITPLFFVETLADLEKEVARGRTPEEVVGNLAYKTPICGALPNVHHASIGVADLLGQRVEIRGVPIIAGGIPLTTGDRRGVLYKQPPEMEALNRWQKGEFLYIERLFAKLWRRALTGLDLETSYYHFGRFFTGVGKPRQFPDVKALVDQLLRQDGRRYEMLRLACNLLGVSDGVGRRIIARWKAQGGPYIPDFAPYAAYVLSVDLFFFLSLAADLISRKRPSNKIDLAYLYYLPFCMVFASNDKLHENTVPFFLRKDQTFVKGIELKADLKNLDEYYSALPEEIRAQGIMRFATYPPLEGDYLVSQLWDRFLPKWRAHTTQRIDMSKVKENEIIERLRHFKEDMKEDEAETPFNMGDADQVILERHVPVRRGKWRLLPPEVENKGDLVN